MPIAAPRQAPSSKALSVSSATALKSQPPPSGRTVASVKPKGTPSTWPRSYLAHRRGSGAVVDVAEEPRLDLAPGEADRRVRPALVAALQQHQVVVGDQRAFDVDLVEAPAERRRRAARGRSPAPGRAAAPTASRPSSAPRRRLGREPEPRVSRAPPGQRGSGGRSSRRLEVGLLLLALLRRLRQVAVEQPHQLHRPAGSPGRTRRGAARRRR